MTVEQIQALINQADEENKKSRFVEAERICREVLTDLQAINSDSDKEILLQRSHVLHQLSFSERRRGMAREALLTAENELSAAIEANSKSEIARAKVDRGAAYHYLTEYSNTLELYTEALAIYETLNEKSGIATVTYYSGITYTKTGNYLLALEYFDKALIIYDAIGDISGIAMVNGDMGLVFSRIGAYSQALEYYIKALAGHEQCLDRRMVAGTRVHIGQVYAYLGSYDTALEYYAKALAEFDELGEKPFKAMVTVNMAEVYFGLGFYDKAFEYSSNGLALFEQLSDTAGAATAMINIGYLYSTIGLFEKALEFNSRALDESEKNGEKLNVASAIGNIGIVYASRDFDGYDAAKAEEYLLKALAIGEELGVSTLAYEFLKYLAELYQQEERWKDYATQLKKYYEIKDEVLSEEAKKTAVQLEQRLQAAEREKEIAIATAKAEIEMNATTNLLHKVLPPSIADRLINGEKIADYFTSVSILFADIVGFTPIASKMPARKVLAFLNYVFGEFDRIIEKYGCEKIKTIGDGYMAVAGAPIECPDHAERIARAACEMMGDIQLPEDIRSSLPKGAIFNIRIGINIGPAFGGIVGEQRFVYDIYSDAVNTAARMESHGEPGRIHVSEDFAFHLQNRMDMTGDDLGGIVFEEREEMEIKGKGKMKTYFMEAIS